MDCQMLNENLTLPFANEAFENRDSRRLSKRFVPVRRIAETELTEESKLRLTVELLTRQLQAKSSQLATMKEQLAESKLNYVEFTSAISHDLRAPLRAISGFSQYLKEEYEEQLDETANEYIKLVSDGSSRMEELIDGLIQYARVKSKELPNVTVDLNELFEDVVMGLENQINDVGAVVTSDTLPEVRGDCAQLTFLLQSLIENGLKFNKSSTPTVHVESQKLDQIWCISVKDNGIGIANENLESAFDIFRQLNPQQEFSGVGAGLAICRRIAEHHSGSVSLESTQSDGTLALINLPVVGVGQES